MYNQGMRTTSSRPESSFDPTFPSHLSEVRSQVSRARKPQPIVTDTVLMNYRWWSMRAVEASGSFSVLSKGKDQHESLATAHVESQLPPWGDSWSCSPARAVHYCRYASSRLEAQTCSWQIDLVRSMLASSAVLKMEAVDVRVDVRVADVVADAGVADATPEVDAVTEAGIVGGIECTWAMVRDRIAAEGDHRLPLLSNSLSMRPARCSKLVLEVENMKEMVLVGVDRAQGILQPVIAAHRSNPP